MDPDISNTYVHQGTAYGIETRGGAGFRRADRCGPEYAGGSPSTRMDVNRPLTPLGARAGEGPGTRRLSWLSHNSGTVTANSLAAQLLRCIAGESDDEPSRRQQQDLSTWEVTATKRQTARWSLLSQCLEDVESRGGPWALERALRRTRSINSQNGQDHFTTWQVRLHGTLSLSRSGSAPCLSSATSRGTPAFARTFVQTLNYGNAIIKAEPFSESDADDQRWSMSHPEGSSASAAHARHVGSSTCTTSSTRMGRRR